MEYLSRFTKLLEQYSGEVIGAELSNDSRINMYYLGDAWVSFEASAYQVARMFKGCRYNALALKDYHRPLVAAFISPQEMTLLRQRLTHEESRHGQRFFAPKPIDAKAYRRWHDRECKVIEQMLRERGN